MKLKYAEECCLLLYFMFVNVLSCVRSPPKTYIQGSNRIFNEPVIKGKVDDAVINEISGLAQSRRHKDVLYVLNDSGGMPRLFALNATTGHLIAIINIRGALNCDWEDIATGTGPYGKSYIYIGDVGGNTKATCNTIYRVEEPLVIENTDVDIHGELKYSWEEPNCETLLVDQNGTLYLVSKVNSGNTPKLYQIPNFAWRFKQITLHSGTAVNISLESQGPVGGDISHSGNEILIKTYNAIYYWRRHLTSSLQEVLQKPPTVVPYMVEPQGEAICWSWQDKGYYTVSEGPNQPLYYYKRSGQTT